MSKKIIIVIIAIVIFFSMPAWADIEVETNNDIFPIADAAYNGSLTSMACSPLYIASDDTDIVDGAVQVEIAIDHTWIGDLVFKLQSPAGTITTLMSRPGSSEDADDGDGVCGYRADLSSAWPVDFLNSGATDAEKMGEMGEMGAAFTVCQDDGLCEFYPNPGAGPGTDLADFDGENAAGTWNFCVGDAVEGDTGDLVSWTLTVNTTSSSIVVPVDIKPMSCPNPLNVNMKGVLSVAILGTEDLDVTEIDPATITLEGVPPLRLSLEDVATPFEPFMGKEDAYDCNEEWGDGYLDLVLKFDAQEVIGALGVVNDGDVLVLSLTGELLDGTPIMGEDVIVILKKGR